MEFGFICCINFMENILKKINIKIHFIFFDFINLFKCKQVAITY